MEDAAVILFFISKLLSMLDISNISCVMAVR